MLSVVPPPPTPMTIFKEYICCTPYKHNPQELNTQRDGNQNYQSHNKMKYKRTHESYQNFTTDNVPEEEFRKTGVWEVM